VPCFVKRRRKVKNDKDKLQTLVIKTLFFQKFNALEEELNKNKPIRVQEMMEQSPSFVYMKNQFCDSQTTSVYNNNSFQIFSGSDSSQQLPFPTNLYSTIPTTTYS